MIEKSDIYFIASKLLYHIIEPETWLSFMISSIALSLYYQRYLIARYIAFISAILILVLGFIPIGMPFLIWLETRFPSNPEFQRIDGLIVLGGAEDPKGTSRWGQVQLNGAAERLTETLKIAKIYPNTKIIYTGGSNFLKKLGKTLSPSYAAEKFFIEQGISPSRLIFEREARNTAENAKLSYRIIEHKKDEKWILITSAYHMPRAMQSFTDAGWTNLVAYPVDFNSTDTCCDAIYWNLSGNLQGLNTIIKEYVGLLVYRFSKT